MAMDAIKRCEHVTIDIKVKYFAVLAFLGNYNSVGEIQSTIYIKF